MSNLNDFLAKFAEEEKKNENSNDHKVDNQQENNQDFIKQDIKENKTEHEIINTINKSTHENVKPKAKTNSIKLKPKINTNKKVMNQKQNVVNHHTIKLKKNSTYPSKQNHMHTVNADEKLYIMIRSDALDNKKDYSEINSIKSKLNKSIETNNKNEQEIAEELFRRSESPIKYKKQWMEIYERAKKSSKDNIAVRKALNGRFYMVDEKKSILLPDMDMSGKTSKELLNMNKWKV